MEVTFYSGFSKRYNSTKRPTGGVVKNVVLKEATSLKAPVFKMTDDGSNYNYCKYGDYYYYIEDKVFYTNNVVEYVASLDVLATNKSQIGSFKGFINRCSQSSPNLFISDPFNTATDVFTTTSVKVGEVLLKSTYYLLMVMCNVGPVGFIMTHQQLRNLYDAILVHDFDELAVNKVMEYIIGLKTVPYYESGSSTEIIIGSWSSGITANYIVLSNHFVSGGETVTLSYPYGSGSYLMREPYTLINVYLPYVGNVCVSPQLINSSGKLKITWCCDLFTGDINYSLTTLDSASNNGLRIANYGGNCSSTIPIGSAVNDAWGYKTAVCDSIFSTASALVAPKSLTSYKGIVDSAYATSKSKDMHGTINGSMSSNLGIKTGNEITVYVTQYKPITSDLKSFNEKYGMMYQKVGDISSINNGCYVQTSGVSLTGCAFNTNSETSALLDGGIYYE